jgi:hypothetical protein
MAVSYRQRNSVLILLYSLLYYVVFPLSRFSYNLQFSNPPSQSQSHIATDGRSVGQSVSKFWCRAPTRAHDEIFITVWQLWSCFFLWGAISHERTGLSFVYGAGPCQRSLSGVRVPWDSRTCFTVSDLRLSFSSPPTTRRIPLATDCRYIASDRTHEKHRFFEYCCVA